MDNVIVILAGGVGVTFVTGVFNLLQTRMTNKAAKDANAINAKESTQQEIKSKMAALESACRALLHIEIKANAREYIAKGEISAHDYKDLYDMYSIYHDVLGGNGALERLMEQVKELPVT